ncbi:hypothetical protein Chro_2968 [Chroococcidiopsis thermalis PCC 7203]|jgi:hypothetical protein|uniref:Uncharacterized protein n=1 Tax=Chroococcidiopsis thermalis (strain PCC 7203) TaxID=251229 RepID=K9U0S2_CHRTP|nr:hypothetical protein Chro_2968 [Chroococcidiopsis thermalis PCC 7203]
MRPYKFIVIKSEPIHFCLNNQLGAIGWLNTLLTSVRAGLIAKLCILVRAIANKPAPTTEQTGLIATLFALLQTWTKNPPLRLLPSHTNSKRSYSLSSLR